MKFKLDENVPWILKQLIESEGNHQVDSVFHEKLTGTDDRELIKYCKEEDRKFITQDNDLLNIDLFPDSSHCGILMLKSKTQGKKAVKSLFEKFLEQFPISDTKNKVIIIEPSQITIRDVESEEE
jgi:predicted nuclease of predicted toxin-antitoxin system